MYREGRGGRCTQATKFQCQSCCFYFQYVGNLSFHFHLALEQHWSMAILIILRTACSVNITDNVSTCFFTLKNLSVVAKWQGSIIISRLLYYMFMYCLSDVAEAVRTKKVFYGFKHLHAAGKQHFVITAEILFALWVIFIVNKQIDTWSYMYY